ncbi:hypothetical protein A2U01_0085956, partial [Trifolium medium]|nr:hypothetical protein [Trifolium medium]
MQMASGDKQPTTGNDPRQRRRFFTKSIQIRATRPPTPQTAS